MPVESEKIKEILNSLENKFIYLKQGGESEDAISQAEELGDMLGSMNKLGMTTYQIDLTDENNRAILIDILKSRGSKIDEDSLSRN